MIKKEEIPNIFYLYFHSKLWESTKDSYLTTTEAEWKMFQWRIPREIRPLILKEMEMLGLFKKEGKRIIRLEKPVFNIDNLNVYYSKLGII